LRSAHRCRRNIQNKEAVKGRCVAYFQKNNATIGLNLDQMTIDIIDVSFHNKRGEAVRKRSA